MPVTYNERSWAIDLIAYMNQQLQGKQLGIRKAGGEHTLHGASGVLFPDVLLFGDRTGQTILQGWELKMPDTPVTDASLIQNATQKAQRLGINSFVVWNVNQVVLHVAQKQEGGYEPTRTWTLPGAPIQRRSAVPEREDDWKKLCNRVLRDMSELLEQGTLRERTIIDTFSDQRLIEALFESTSATAEALQKAIQSDNQFRAEVALWWEGVKAEYPDRDQVEVLAHRSIAGWAAKVIFLHVLKSHCSAAQAVETLSSSSSKEEAFDLFERVIASCNFAHVFQAYTGESRISPRTWDRLVQLNGFFSTVDIDTVGAEATQMLLRSTVSASQRKAAGQFTTPPALARFLVRVAVHDQTKTVLDPCCGTGTIASAAYDEKQSVGIAPDAARECIWASDKYAFPLQAATLALSRPEQMGKVLHIFQEDVLNLEVGSQISFRHPETGATVHKQLPAAHCIVSNLPFVQFEDVETSASTIQHVKKRVARETDELVDLPGRSDLYAYLPFHLWTLLEDGGRAGLILSNAWLGTDWGAAFREALQQFYHIEKGVVSGQGRWFQNADVVASLLILRKRTPVENPPDQEATAFITTEKKLHTTDDEAVQQLASYATLNRAREGWLQAEIYTNHEIDTLEQAGIEWTALFSDINWLKTTQDVLIPVNELFDIGRGERRGWNPLFYPKGDHSIEDVYLEPGLKRPSHAKGLIAEPDIDVFSCSRSIQELEQRGHQGALAWIRRFEHETNTTGRPLPEVLSKSNMHWYEMQTDSMADFVLPVNPYQRLFIPRLRNRAFVDQRFTRFTLAHPEVDPEICHALLNSIVGLFLIEALGFGRGLGALDLSTTRAKRQLHMLNPGPLTSDQCEQIRDAFQLLLQRTVHPLPEELKRSDRRAFDQVVLEAYGLADQYGAVRNALERLYRTRMAAAPRS